MERKGKSVLVVSDSNGFHSCVCMHEWNYPDIEGLKDKSKSCFFFCTEVESASILAIVRVLSFMERAFVLLGSSGRETNPGIPVPIVIRPVVCVTVFGAQGSSGVGLPSTKKIWGWFKFCWMEQRRHWDWPPSTFQWYLYQKLIINRTRAIR